MINPPKIMRAAIGAQRISLVALLAAFLMSPWHRAESVTLRANGIAEISRDKLVLTTPPDRPSFGSLRYALSFPFQAGPTTVGLMVMRMVEETTNYGFLDGSDVILLDELKPPRRDNIFAASRNEIEKDKTGAPPRLFLKSPLIGGFVPREALRVNGTPHPHAGTGFGVGQAHRFGFSGDRFTWRDPDRRDMNEVYQLAYDGKTFTSRRTDVRAQNADDPLLIADTGWSILVTGISSAIPDGDDMLLPTLAARLDRTAVSVGIVRWACRKKTWQPVGYDPVDTTLGPVPVGPNPMERCPWMEPSLARDADGNLLFSARGADAFSKPGAAAPELGYTLRVWRSARTGEWKQVLNEPKTRLNSPVTINVAADGTAYLVSNPYDQAFIPETQKTGRGREKLVVWPLKGDRTGIEPPLLIRDCLGEFGEPPPSADGDEKWMADHPNGLTVRLKDGWHHILCYRVCHSPRYRASGISPSPHSGSYIEEVRSRGPLQAVWRFAKEK
jgi:hypothetical protein